MVSVKSYINNLNRLKKIIGVFLIITGLFFVALFSLLNYSQVINNLLVYLTLLAIIWYAEETKRLREETANQKHLSVYPLIIPMQMGENVYVVNIGKGPAMKYNVNFGNSGYTIAVNYFQYSNILPPIFNDQEAKLLLVKISIGEEESVQGIIDKNYRNAISNGNTQIKTNKKSNLGSIVFKYQDIYGKYYMSKILITPVGFRLSEYKIL